MGAEIENKQSEINKPPIVSSHVTEKNSNLSATEVGSSVAAILIIVVIVVLILCLLQKMHVAITRFFEFIISVPWYKRTVLILIGAISTYLTTKVPTSFSSFPIIIGYITTFAFNEFASKKDIEKAKAPLEEDIIGKEKTIALFRRIVEEKKNTFQDIIINRINACVRITGKNDSDTLRKLKIKICELQDIIFAEKTFTETPDEALRRYENSVSGDVDMAAQTMFGDSRSEQAAAA